MSNLSTISITHTFNGDTSATGKVNTADLDTQLGNLATAQNQTKSALDTITDGANNLAAETVGLSQLKPELATALDSGLSWLQGSATWDPASVASGSSTSTTVSVTGALLGDYCIASFSLTLQGMSLSAYVSAADTVTVVLTNNTGGPINLSSGTIRVSVMRF